MEANNKVLKKGKIPLNLFSKLNNAIQQYVRIFEEKHDLGFHFWIGDQIGGTADFNGAYSVCFKDIRLDLENDIPKKYFNEWYDMIGIATDGDIEITYYSFLKNKNLI
ncbi:hypothetical protein [Wenyingzhuangia sp. 2_MG-2023]|uniref:hypothetical protein n=1 Tax=Wenyingzhuangia sp. 2_MG-2023 TaxID=3062639 RepID=UPI0026E3E710|nr:hypothetical protein [Wenyingzhuangia sp. 2_MG-2023]MDO6737079.1 hypothetical protein [Wenyingzhuangia sp. 2_MG-2023]